MTRQAKIIDELADNSNVNIKSNRSVDDRKYQDISDR